MTANNKEDFLFQLHNELHRIGIDADEDIFADFEEHFKASAGEGLSEEETCRRLGDVKEIARGYLNMESSRINSLVAREVESERPRVSLTKPGHTEPADSSLKTAPSAPIREYTPEHFSEEIYPDSQRVRLEKPEEAQSAQASQNAQGAQAAQNTQSAQSTQNAQNTQANGEPSVAEAFSAAGRAAAEAFRTAGHAVAEAVNTDAVKGAGKAAADAMKTAGHAVADAMRTSAENIKAAQAAQAAQKAQADSVPHPQDTARECCSDSRTGYVPPQDGTHNIKTKNEFSFASIKGMKPNVNAGKLIGVLVLDVCLWWWLIAMLVGIAGALGFGVFPSILGAGFSTLFNSASEYYLITRVFLGVAQISSGIIFLMLVCLLVKGIVNIIKNVVISHIKAIYDL